MSRVAGSIAARCIIEPKLTVYHANSRRSDPIMSDTQVQEAVNRPYWRLLINGEHRDAANGERTFNVTNPATNEVFTTVALAGREDADAAVAAAREAFDKGKWPRLGAARRAGMLHKVAQIMRQ